MKQTLKEITIRGVSVALRVEGVNGQPLYTVEWNGATVYASLDRGHATAAFGLQCEQASKPAGEVAG